MAQWVPIMLVIWVELECMLKISVLIDLLWANLQSYGESSEMEADK